MQAMTWQYDSSVISIPWTSQTSKERVRLGVVVDDGIFTPSPPVRRALKRAYELLQRSHSVEVIPITLTNVQEYYGDLIKYFTLDGGKV
jgi:amidase